jgi:DNA primase
VAGDTVSQIKDRIDVVDLVGSRVQLRQAGRNFKGLCPFHNEKTPSFVVFPDSQSYHCFGCGKSGDIFSFVMDTDNLDFSDALARLAERANVEIKPATPRDPEGDAHRDKLIELNERAASYFASMLWTAQAGSAARGLLERRGVDRHTGTRFGLGFAPDSWDSLKHHLMRHGDVDESQLLEAGLQSRNDSGQVYDRFRNRLMFPIRDREGRTIGFGARALGDEMPKYLNSPQTAVFNKSNTLYALDLAQETIRKERTLVVVEGYMDAIAAHQFGYTNVVASMGTALTPQQVGSIRRYVDRVFLALDSDAAGQLATLRAIDSVRESFSDDSSPTVSSNSLIRFEKSLAAEVRIVPLAGGKDPDEIIRAEPANWDIAIRQAVPLVEFVLRTRLADVEPTPAARATALREDVVPLLREIRDQAVLAQYIGLAARLLDYKDNDVRAALRSRPDDSVRSVSLSERPVARDPERHLVAILLRHPSVAAGNHQLMQTIDLDDILDARNREILRLLLNQPGADDVFALVPEEIEEYARELQSEVPARPDWSPGLVQRDIRQAIQTLRRTRHLFRESQVKRELASAKSAGDTEAVLSLVQQMSTLAQRRNMFDPETSPYFKDSRTVDA